MDKIEKRNEIRIDYQIEILNLLRRGKRTTTELAKRLGVSFTTINNIADELVKGHLIKYSNKKESKTRGRNPVFVELNCDEGVVCSVDLSSYSIRVAIATLDSQVIVEEVIPSLVFLTMEHLEQIEQTIKKLLKTPEVNNRKLLSICIASPGLMRPDSQAEIELRRDRAVFLRQRRRTHREKHQAVRSRRTRDHGGQQRIPESRPAARGDLQTRLCLARHRHARQHARRRQLHPHGRDASGAPDRLPAGDRVRKRLDDEGRRARQRAGHAQNRIRTIFLRNWTTS